MVNFQEYRLPLDYSYDHVFVLTKVIKLLGSLSKNLEEKNVLPEKVHKPNMIIDEEISGSEIVEKVLGPNIFAIIKKGSMVYSTLTNFVDLKFPLSLNHDAVLYVPT